MMSKETGLPVLTTWVVLPRPGDIQPATVRITDKRAAQVKPDFMAFFILLKSNSPQHIAFTSQPKRAILFWDLYTLSPRISEFGFAILELLFFLWRWFGCLNDRFAHQFFSRSLALATDQRNGGVTAE